MVPLKGSGDNRLRVHPNRLGSIGIRYLLGIQHQVLNAAQFDHNQDHGYVNQRGKKYVENMVLISFTKIDQMCNLVLSWVSTLVTIKKGKHMEHLMNIKPKQQTVTTPLNSNTPM